METLKDLTLPRESSCQKCLMERCCEDMPEMSQFSWFVAATEFFALGALCTL